ncbi:hypothetical protein CEXT_714371 [Caerostris extrusa]|uniref:Uncharacterized protein n=1 Tax=Caerostris extrusa TaxID=172846 RepID=A0AAV4U115_CAEEX|nr:hypothetical protein CEXT_714371 [Caerostris extrusa]
MHDPLLFWADTLAGGIRIKTLPILTNGQFDGPLWHLPTRTPITLQAPIVEKNPPTINKACQYASKMHRVDFKAKNIPFLAKDKRPLQSNYANVGLGDMYVVRPPGPKSWEGQRGQIQMIESRDILWRVHLLLIAFQVCPGKFDRVIEAERYIGVIGGRCWS